MNIARCSVAGLGLALMGLAAGQGLAAPSERLSEHRDARDGRLLFLRNDDAQVTREQAARRGAAKRPATLPVFNRDELNSPAWSNEVATARQSLARHGRAFAGNDRFLLCQP